MSDAVILGLGGLFATTVLGPLIAHHIRRDEEGRRDIINALDGAVQALATARASVIWVADRIEGEGQPRQLEPEIRRALHDLHVAQSYTTRLHLRLGPRGIAELYDTAVEALAVIGGDAHARSLRTSGPTPAQVAEANRRLEPSIGDFVDAARRWHEEHVSQS